MRYEEFVYLIEGTPSVLKPIIKKKDKMGFYNVIHSNPDSPLAKKLLMKGLGLDTAKIASKSNTYLRFPNSNRTKVTGQIIKKHGVKGGIERLRKSSSSRLRTAGIKLSELL